MKNFKTIHNCPSWKDLLEKFGNEECFLFLKNDTEFVFAWGVDSSFVQNEKVDFSSLDQFISNNSKSYLLGYFGYDIKNSIEDLESSNPDFMEFPEVYLVNPKNVILVLNNSATYFGPLSVENIENEINKADKNEKNNQSDKIELKSITSKENYLNKLDKMKSHIHRGDIYELNYCINFTADVNSFDSINAFIKLYEETQAPFTSYVNTKWGTILSASPERFLKKENNLIISQPIKGTAPRSDKPKIDKEISNNLKIDEKERAENVMIVDLVRNDLSKFALKNSVVVPELFGVYTFKSVHQLISTVECEVDSNIKMSHILRSAFPMGSMTGAPKINAMKFSEKYEDFKRSVYAGSIVIFDPFGNFDSNVVIRSLIYNAKSNILSAPVGGAITIKSIPEKEYEECLLKLNATQKALC